jgi:glycerophosphoryl diester phosphodiesterase
MESIRMSAVWSIPPPRSCLIGPIVVMAALAALPACGARTADAVPEAPVTQSRLLVAHRGASAYAPEHTLPAYELAIEQGADFIEPDLQVTRDGILVALHDVTLERTTNVRDVFPDRFREVTGPDGRTVRGWYVSDFTLEEIKRLDAGSWFDERFRGARVPTLAEVIEVAVGRAGIFPETKAPEEYGQAGLHMEELLVAELERYSLREPGANAGTPVVIQSFSAESLRILRHELGSQLPLTLLVGYPDSEGWLTPAGLSRAREFASGVGPAKRLLLEDPTIVATAHGMGFTVVPWTFRSDDSGDFPDVAAEMAHFLDELGVDGLFTNNPDLFPRIRADGS